MVKKPAEQVAETASKAVTKSGDAAEKIVKGNADALTESGNASRAAIQELTKAYQELASKNAKNLTAAMQALAAVKSPTEFMELQQRLIKEGVAAAVSDSKHIAQLTTAVFTAAFEPVKKQIELVRRPRGPRLCSNNLCVFCERTPDLQEATPICAVSALLQRSTRSVGRGLDRQGATRIGTT